MAIEIRPETDLERSLYRQLLAARLAATPCKVRVIDADGRPADRVTTIDGPSAGRDGDYFARIDLADMGIPGRILDDDETYPAAVSVPCSLESHDRGARLELGRLPAAWAGIEYIKGQMMDTDGARVYMLTIRLTA